MDSIYDLRIEIEELNDGGDYRYMGTSPDLPNLTVVGDTIEEVMSLAPGVARALIEAMKDFDCSAGSGKVQQADARAARFELIRQAGERNALSDEEAFAVGLELTEAVRHPLPGHDMTEVMCALPPS